MSADNYIVIRRHPAGGFTPVMGFASDDAEPVVDPTIDWPYPTVESALLAADPGTEYGVTVHPECRVPVGQPLYRITSGRFKNADDPQAAIDAGQRLLEAVMGAEVTHDSLIVLPGSDHRLALAASLLRYLRKIAEGS